MPTETATACRDYARDVLDAKRLIAIIHPDNAPSQRVAAKIGLTQSVTPCPTPGHPVRVYATAL